MTIIFAGSIGRFPVGGHAWVDMQYLLGLRALGHDVVYLEDCGKGSWVYAWETGQLTTELAYPTEYLRACLEGIGWGPQWIYRAGEQTVGMEKTEFMERCSQADLLIVRGAPLEMWRTEYDRPKRRIFIDSDPGFTQIRLANDDHDALVSTVEWCEHLFTIGQRLGAPNCPIPTAGRHWKKTVPPISLPHWPFAGDDSVLRFTTVMQWYSYDEVVYNGTRYGNKDLEFAKFIGLPQCTEQPFQIAATGPVPEAVPESGWDVVTGWVASRTPLCYQRFIQQSRAEFSVAKQGYVETQGGWFSDRSICYLASGRPVLVQDTGLSDWLPVGEGLLTFRTASEALQGVETINTDYTRHRRAARAVVEQHFRRSGCFRPCSKPLWSKAPGEGRTSPKIQEEGNTMFRVAGIYARNGHTASQFVDLMLDAADDKDRQKMKVLAFPAKKPIIAAVVAEERNPPVQWVLGADGSFAILDGELYNTAELQAIVGANGTNEAETLLALYRA